MAAWLDAQEREVPRPRVRLAVLGQAALATAFAVVPLTFTATVLSTSLRESPADFAVFWSAGRDFLHGDYHFVYPAPAALALAPFGALPYDVAAPLFLLLVTLCIPAALLVLGVRDWRCHGAAFLGAAVLAVLGSGSLSSVLLLALALAWRYRDRAAVLAPVVATAVVLKLFLWPLLIWLVATRRLAALAWTLAAGTAAAAAAWALVGFQGLREYPAVLRSLADSQAADGYSLMSFWLALGAPTGTARLATALAAVAAFAALVVMARRDDGDRCAFVLTIAIALLISPTVWLHYFALLLVPIALARTRLSPLWLVPLAFWLTPMKSNGNLAAIAVALAVSAVVVAASFASRPHGTAAHA